MPKGQGPTKRKIAIAMMTRAMTKKKMTFTMIRMTKMKMMIAKMTRAMVKMKTTTTMMLN